MENGRVKCACGCEGDAIYCQIGLVLNHTGNPARVTRPFFFVDPICARRYIKEHNIPKSDSVEMIRATAQYYQGLLVRYHRQLKRINLENPQLV